MADFLLLTILAFLFQAYSQVKNVPIYLILFCTILHNYDYLCTKLFANGLMFANATNTIMITTKLYLDTRRLKDDGTAPLKLSVTNNRKTTYINLGINLRPIHWDSKSLQVLGSQKIMLNQQIATLKYEIETIIRNIPNAHRLTPQEIKQKVEQTLSGIEENNALIAPRFESYGTTLSNRTKQIYITTLAKLKEFDKKFAYRTFDEIGKDYLQRFDAFLATSAPSANTRSIYMRCLRAIFNDAIDNDITSNYPFRKFKIKTEATRKRSYTVEEIRRILTSDLPGRQGKYMDLFKLSFYLIGINIIDLLHLNNIYKGRVEYNRAKTKRLYSIKVETEAMAIIEKYRGKDYLLSYMDTNVTYRTVYKHLQKTLAESKDMFGVDELTTYWARHTWATIASELDIPKDTIAAALGHGGNSVTDIYINFDIKKVDEANRKVLDYVLYDKK